MPKTNEECGGKWKCCLEKFDTACIVRSVVVAIFLAGAVVCGVYIRFDFEDMEHDVIEDRYYLSSNRGLATLENGLRLRMQGMVVLSKVAGFSHNIDSAWPEAVVPGFFDTVQELLDMVYLDNICFMPIVQPEELPSFETFIFKYFDSEPAIPPDAGMHSFGKGVFALNPNNLSQEYHDTTGVTLRYKSTNDFLTPIFQRMPTAQSPEFQLTYNAHSSPRVGPYMDQVIDDCLPELSNSADPRQCGLITNSFPTDVDLLQFAYTLKDYRALFLQPVILGQNKSNVIGFTNGELSWHRILAQSFYAYVGLDVVIVNGDHSFTYTINKIEYAADYVGEGDLHDPTYTKYKAELVVSAELLGLTDDLPYRVYVYPNAIFFHHSHTSIIIGAAVGVVIGLVTILFAAYDVMMRRETRRKAELLSAKRKFVRFISHEIRTPLNSVHLGLELLVEELKHIAQQLNATHSISVSLLARVKQSLVDWLELAADLVGNSESAVDVLNDLLNYDKIEMGTLRLDFAAVSIWPLLEKTTSAFIMQARQTEITLNTCNGLLEQHTAEEIPTLVVLGDSGRIAQVLRNLLSNALKFTPAGGTITVTGNSASILNGKSFLMFYIVSCITFPQLSGMQMDCQTPKSN